MIPRRPRVTSTHKNIASFVSDGHLLITTFHNINRSREGKGVSSPMGVLGRDKLRRGILSGAVPTCTVWCD